MTKITMRGVNETYLKDRPLRERQVSRKTPEKTDKITISMQEPKTDVQFVDALKAKILNEIKAGTSADKLKDLKKQVSAGEYDINPADIVNKMWIV